LLSTSSRSADKFDASKPSKEGCFAGLFLSDSCRNAWLIVGYRNGDLRNSLSQGFKCGVESRMGGNDPETSE
jgi:hypothetical protein